MVKEQHPTTCCIFPFALIDIPSYSSRLPPEAPNIKRLTPPLNTQIRDLARRKSYIRRTTTPLLQKSTPIPHKRLTSSAWTESDRVYREALLGVLAPKMIASKRGYRSRLFRIISEVINQVENVDENKTVVYSYQARYEGLKTWGDDLP